MRAISSMGSTGALDTTVGRSSARDVELLLAFNSWEMDESERTRTIVNNVK